jgi:hypothetical protein
VSTPRRDLRPEADPPAEPVDLTRLTAEELAGLREGLAEIERGELVSLEQAATQLDASLRAALAAARLR